MKRQTTAALKRFTKDLTPSQHIIYLMTCSGFTIKETAEALSVCTRTVEAHRRTIDEKIAVHGLAWRKHLELI